MANPLTATLLNRPASTAIFFNILEFFIAQYMCNSRDRIAWFCPHQTTHNLTLQLADNLADMETHASRVQC